MMFRKISQSLGIVAAVLITVLLLAASVFAQTPQGPSISYQARVTINEMIQTDLQTPGSSITVNQSGGLSYDDPTGFDGLSVNQAYDALGDELATFLSPGDTVVITAAGANLIQNGNAFPLDIDPNTVPVLSSGATPSGSAYITGTLTSANEQYDTFLPNLPGFQAPIDLYVVYGPNLQQRTPTLSFDRAACGTADILDFCFNVTGVYRDDYFSIYQDLPRTVRDVKLIGPYQFSVLAGTDDLATFQQRWYYIIYDWRYTRPDGSRSQTFSNQLACQTQANLVATNATCTSFLGNTIRHSHYFDDENACKAEAVAVSGDSEAICYSTQIRNIQITFDIPTAAIDGQFPNPPTTTLVGQTSAFLNGTIDTKGVPALIHVEAFGVPRYVLDAQGNPQTDANGFKLESRVNNTTFQQPFGSTYQRINLSLANDPNIHILTTQEIPANQSLETNPNDPRPFTIAFNLPSTTATINFNEPLKKDYIYYYRVYNPAYIPNGTSNNLFELPSAPDTEERQGLTYSQGWFTTGDVKIDVGGEVLGGVILNATGDVALGTLEIEDIDGLVACGKKDQVRYYYVIETPAADGGLATRAWSQFYADETQCLAASPGELECFENTMCTYNDFIGLIDRIISYLLLLIGPLAAIMFAYAGFLLVTSHENADKRTQARKIFLNTAIGIVIILLAWVAVAQFLHMLGLDPDYVLLKIGS